MKRYIIKKLFESSFFQLDIIQNNLLRFVSEETCKSLPSDLLYLILKKRPANLRYISILNNKRRYLIVKKIITDMHWAIIFIKNPPVELQCIVARKNPLCILHIDNVSQSALLTSIKTHWYRDLYQYMIETDRLTEDSKKEINKLKLQNGEMY